jgi:hypothetical protein
VPSSGTTEESLAAAIMSLTKGPLDVGCTADRPTHETSAEDCKIEITSEMVDAGWDAYTKRFADLRGPDMREVSRLMVIEVFSAMEKARARNISAS